ncbi:MAG: TolC family protein [Candidatus Neomarinimicrobiota bacterium]|jgi:NodT family efflux transporter outer membrane factor (OMF) lipoprotein|tara:strand:+ start:2883 stop:4313 length:1431 start_codon:yes stop_codon:yes gene_type:complete
MKLYLMIFIVFFSACAEKFSTNDFSISESIPSSWDLKLTDSSTVIGDWWESFEDSLFNDVLSDFNKSSPDLKTISSRMNVAKQILKINKASRLPSFSLGMNGTSRKQNLTAFGLSDDFFGGGPDSSQSNDSGSGVTSFSSSNFGLNLTMQWELDVWGKLFNRARGASSEYQSAYYDLSFLSFSMRIQLAKLYFSTVESLEQYELSKETYNSVSELADMVSARYDKGLRSSLDLRLTKSSVASSKAQMEIRKQAYLVLVRRLESMLGKYPSGKYVVNSELASKLPSIAIGIPSEILNRRPDIKSSLAKLQAASHKKSESISSLLPSFILTSSTGNSSNDLNDVLNEDYQIWSQGLTVGLPLFQGGSIRANKNIAEENLNIAKQNLIKTIINAYSEVEQTLFAENSNDILLDAYENAAEQAEAAYKLSRERYDSGLVDLIAVMDSQQRWFLSRSQVLAAKKNKIDTRLNLLLAFGGNF